ncbi:hypothetical protein L1987_75794 [Smallanthus sonchifolius]|uniref:Uncharacterized protein n=1 Tax=Smallanthus sonchifolius TaxID=185202 RepID=A0ACB9A7H6_9ASTR|nr:hypothetical protein L1987_75794 [Smallanthus sonchifolius]
MACARHDVVPRVPSGVWKAYYPFYCFVLHLSQLLFNSLTSDSFISKISNSSEFDSSAPNSSSSTYRKAKK